jgi:RimJ/RimL family protein N-acetyltransferase
MTEDDWAILLKWNRDPEVLYYAEGENILEHSLEEVQEIYRSVSQTAFCFIIEYNSAPVGECWLQRMNLERILRQYPGLDCRRIDLMIGEKVVWGRGIGTEVVQLLTTFGFESERADVLFGCDVADYNVGSLRVFQKAGFAICAKIEQPPDNKARYRYDLLLTREISTSPLQLRELSDS